MKLPVNGGRKIGSTRVNNTRGNGSFPSRVLPGELFKKFPTTLFPKSEPTDSFSPSLSPKHGTLITGEKGMAFSRHCLARGTSWYLDKLVASSVKLYRGRVFGQWRVFSGTGSRIPIPKPFRSRRGPRSTATERQLPSKDLDCWLVSRRWTCWHC